MFRASLSGERMKRKTITILLAVTAFLIALGLTLYPLIAEKYNASHQSAIHADYSEILERTDETEKAQALELARQYNEMLKPGVQEAFSQDILRWASDQYADQLNIAGNGIMGYVVIPSIDVNLPILHGTDDGTLAKGVGHLLGSSLPVGGTGTHTVLAGHSGMASQKMFSNLPDMQIGDVFYLDVLGQRLAYRVTEIHTVLPYETSLLEIESGKDLCTLVTCTPYGINTHRLLVRGERIPYTEPAEEETIEAENTSAPSTWERQYGKGVLVGILVVTGFGILLWSIQLGRKHHA